MGRGEDRLSCAKERSTVALSTNGSVRTILRHSAFPAGGSLLAPKETLGIST
jgi:hypothetical protein